MKANNPLKKILAVAIVAIAIPTTIYAAVSPEDGAPVCGPRGIPGKHAEGIPPFFKELSLSEAQKSQIKTIVENEKPNMQSQFRQRHELIRSLHEISDAEQFDNNKAELIADQLAALEKQQTLARAQKDHEIYALLTPEQRTKMQDIIKKRIEKHDEKARMQPSKWQGKLENNGLTTM